MKTDFNVSIEVDTADEHDVERFQARLKEWLDKQKEVLSATVAVQGDLDAAAWRAARTRSFGSRLPSPFGKPR